MLKRFLILFAASFGFAHLANAQDQNQLPKTTSDESGYFNTTELNIARGFLNENKTWLAGLQMVNGYNFNQKIAVGLGIGLEKHLYVKYSDNSIDGTGRIMLPVFTDVRIYLKKGDQQPYFSQAVGYAFNVYQPGYNSKLGYNNERGGLMVNPSFGVKTKMTENTSFNISIGYRYQVYNIKNLAYQMYYNADPTLFFRDFTSTAHYITLKTGLTF